MKGFIEFKGYRTRTTYDPESKGFVARRVEYSDFDMRDSKVQTETQVRPIGPSKPELKAQQIQPKTLSESSIKPHRRSKSKPKPNVSTRSSVTMAT